MGFIVIVLALTAAFAIGFWYRGWVHTIKIGDGDGEHLGG